MSLRYVEVINATLTTPTMQQLQPPIAAETPMHVAFASASSRARKTFLHLRRPTPPSLPLRQTFGFDHRGRNLPAPVRSLILANGNCSTADLMSSKPMSGFLEFEYQVRTYEVDQYGVVNNAIYANYCQHARHELVARVTGLRSDEVARTGDAIATSELSLKFLGPLRSGDRFVVKVRVSKCSAVRVFFEHFIYKLPTQEPVLEAKAACVWLNSDYRPVCLPTEITSKLAGFMMNGGASSSLN